MRATTSAARNLRARVGGSLAAAAVSAVSAAALLSSVGALGGCTGYIGGSGENGSGAGGGESASADAGLSDPAVAEGAMRRLSLTELKNTVQDLLTASLVESPGAAAQVLSDLQSALSLYPVDAPVSGTREPELGAGYTRLDTNVTQGHVNALYSIGAAVAAALTSSPARIGAVVGACATDADPSNDAACLQTFVSTFGALALRRPLTSDDVAFYTSAAAGASSTGSDAGTGGQSDGGSAGDAGDAGAAVASGAVSPRALAAVITLLLNAPDFVYHVENGDPDVTATLAPLTPYELASRLSYNFWETMPDAELRAKASDGSLLHTDVLTAEVNRLINDPRAAAPMAEFFAQWLRVNLLPELDLQVGTSTFTNFAAGFVPTAQTRANAIADVTNAGAWVTLNGGSLNDFLTNKQSFATAADVASLYGVPPWDGTSTPPTPSDPARVGLITRVAFLASGYVSTNPILKGVGLRLALLCYPLQPPPAVAMGKSVAMSPSQTTREETEALTESGQPCVSCHGNLINPLGFATENFDALGRTRTAEDLFDNFGNIVAQKPVNTASTPQIVPGDLTPSSGAADLTRQIAASGLVASCFAQNYFSFAMGRHFESPANAPADQATASSAADQATVAAIAAKASQGSLRDAFASIVFQPQFLQKSFQ